MKWEDFQSSQNVEDRRGGDQYADRAAGRGSAPAIWASARGDSGPHRLYDRHKPGHTDRRRGDAQRHARRQTAARIRALADDGPATTRWAVRRQDSWRERGGLVAGSAGAKNIAFQPRGSSCSMAKRSRLRRAQSAMGRSIAERPQNLSRHVVLSRYETRFGGGGDFAYAYVISHEMGITSRISLAYCPKRISEERAASQAEANALSVRIELMRIVSPVWAPMATPSDSFGAGDIEKASRPRRRSATTVTEGDARRRRADSFTMAPRRSGAMVATRSAIRPDRLLQHLFER